MTENENLRNKSIEFLGDIISSESAKPDDEANFDLIEECEKLLYGLVDDKINLSNEEINKRVRKITHRKRKVSSRIGSGLSRRVAAAICAAVILCIGVGATCMINPNIRDGIMTVLGIGAGESVEIDSITFTNEGTVKKYSNIETLLKDNDIDIMYPHKLPDGLKIVEIDIQDAGLFPIDLIFDDYRYSVGVYKIGESKVEELKSVADTIEVNGMTFFVVEANDQWIALLSNSLYTYVIYSANEADLLILMEDFR